MNLASLRIDPRHHVFDCTVLAGGVHRLEHHEQSPSILRIEPVLQFRHLMDPALEQLDRVLIGLQTARLPRIKVLEAEMLSALDTKRLDEFLTLHVRILRRVAKESHASTMAAREPF